MKKIYDNYHIDLNGNVYNKHNKILKPVDNGKGYLRVNLTLLDGTIICKAIHRLIAEAYIETDYSMISDSDFEITLKKYALFKYMDEDGLLEG